MQIEFTARQVTITPGLRKLAEEGLERVIRILGNVTSAEVVLAAEKHRQKADITLKTRQQTIVGSAEADTLIAALRTAIERADVQAVRYMDKTRERKRLPKEEKSHTASPAPRSTKTAAARNSDAPPTPATVARTKAHKSGELRAVLVHSFPATKPIPEPHVVRSIDAFALLPMSLEEAVKEAEFRDKEVFVFRDPDGELKILHRKRDGKMELIEVPT
jgi:putative sigma-54 modulation protein